MLGGRLGRRASRAFIRRGEEGHGLIAAVTRQDDEGYGRSDDGWHEVFENVAFANLISLRRLKSYVVL